MTLKSFFSCFQKEKPSKIDGEIIHLNITAHGSTTSSSSAAPSPDGSTSALIESIIPLVLPLVRKAISKQLIQDGSVLFEEQPLTLAAAGIGEEDDLGTMMVGSISSSPAESDGGTGNTPATAVAAPVLPIGNIEVTIENVCVMDHITVQKDMVSHPEFHWPEKGNDIPSLMKNVPGIGRKMLVLDLIGFNCLIPLNPGMELCFPADLPFGVRAHVEIGCGGDVKDAWVRLEIPRMRIWFVSASMKLYVAVMDRPRLTPNLHVNADRGKGDFMNLVLQEDGNLDDVVETILAGFGPKPKKQDESKSKTKKEMYDQQSSTAAASSSTSWIGSVVGRKISQMVRESMGGKADEHCPLEIDISGTIQASIDAAMGKIRSVDAVKADIAILERELDLAIKAEKGGALSAKNDVEEILKVVSKDGEDASNSMFCGCA